MNIQIFGIKKCFDTKKADRYFKERNIKFSYVDLSLKGLSKGELESVLKNVSNINNLINEKSKEYKRLNIANIRSKEMKEELLLKNPLLLKTPIVRNGKLATVGFNKEVWDTWIE